MFDLYSTDEENSYPRLYVPKGFAHGFLSLKPNTIFEYQVDAEHKPEKDRSINWKSFPELKDLMEKHNFNTENMIISDKDKNAPTLEEWLKHNETVI